MAGAQYVTIVNYLRKGKDGKDGEDGVVVRITPDTLVFSTDDNGEIKNSSLSQTAQIKVFKGSEDITASCIFADENAVFVNCRGYVSSENVVDGSAVGLVQFSAINTAATVDGHKIPCTAGYVNISIPCMLDGKTYTAQVKFTVDGGSFWGGLSSTSKGLVASYTSISGRVDSAEGKIGTLDTANGNLTKRVGTLEVTSDRISAKVSQAEVRDRNLIPNSYVNQGSSIYGFCKRKVRLEKDKSYAMSIWGRIDDTLSARGGSMRAYVYKEDGNGTWTYTQYVDLTSTTDSKAETKWTHAGATGEYQFAVYPYPHKDDGGKCFLRCAQIEEIEDEVNGYGTAWSANKDDAVALGNILSDIRSNTWIFGDGVALADDKAEIDGKLLDVIAGASSSSTNLDVVDSGKVLTLGRGSVYTLSFWAQGSGSFNTYLYNGSSSGCSWAVRDDGNWSVDGNGAVAPDRTLTDEWARYSVTFSIDTDSKVGVIPVQLRKNGRIAIAGLKLEPYGRATEYTDRAITAEEMLATGFDIYNRKIIATADNFEVRNNRGEVTTKVDADGQLTAGILATRNRGEGYIKAEDGLMKMFNGKGQMNIKFGLDPNSGMVVLSYYDNEGNLLYDLGPDGLNSIDLQKSALTEYWMESPGTFFNNKIGPSTYSDDVYTYDDNGNRIIDSKFKEILMPYPEIHEGYEPASVLGKKVMRYYYRSARLKGDFINDAENGITTRELARLANNKWYTQKPICVDGTLKVIQDEEYIMFHAPLHYSRKLGSEDIGLAITFMGFENGVRDLYDVFVE